MPFKDTKQGQTHSYNDGCGEPEHNDYYEMIRSKRNEMFPPGVEFGG